MRYASTHEGFRVPSSRLAVTNHGAFSMPGGEPMLTTDTEPERAEDFVDDFLRLVAHVRGMKTRDPLRTLEDCLLDLRVRTCA